jgi:hypothetical protein
MLVRITAACLSANFRRDFTLRICRLPLVGWAAVRPTTLPLLTSTETSTLPTLSSLCLPFFLMLSPRSARPFCVSSASCQSHFRCCDCADWCDQSENCAPTDHALAPLKLKLDHDPPVQRVRPRHQSHLNRTPRWRHGDFATSTAVALLRVVVQSRVAAPQARVQGTQAGGWLPESKAVGPVD